MTDETGPVLDHINVVVRGMQPMVEFYRRLGLNFADMPAPWNRHHQKSSLANGFDFDLDSYEFAKSWNEGLPDRHSRVVIGFRLPDRDAVDRTYADLTDAGYAGQQPPYDAFWGARYAVVEDPDGNSVGLMSPIDPARRTQPPAPPT
jgi:uncharacterized glyoxalase superfamily protein PhnB